jgi:hypothetical protein
MITDPIAPVSTNNDDLRRRALANMLRANGPNMGANNPAFATTEGTIGTALQALFANPQLMQGAMGMFGANNQMPGMGAPKTGAVMPDALTGLLPGPR